MPITNRYGLTLEEDFDAIVISPETESIAIKINKKYSTVKKSFNITADRCINPSYMIS